MSEKPESAPFKEAASGEVEVVTLSALCGTAELCMDCNRGRKGVVEGHLVVKDCFYKSLCKLLVSIRTCLSFIVTTPKSLIPTSAVFVC